VVAQVHTERQTQLTNQLAKFRLATKKQDW